MSKWNVVFLPEVEADRRALDGFLKKQVDKAILKVSENPLHVNEGGYGKSLGNKGNSDLTGLMKVKLKTSGLRIIYKLVRDADTMKIVVIGFRADEEVYKEADKRIHR